MNAPDHSSESPRWQRRPAERRREILDAAVDVFGRDGFDDATLADVARQAGVSAGTVVHYFGSKGELFEAVLTDRFMDDLGGPEALLASHRGSYRELVRAILARKWSQLSRPGTTDLLLFGLAKAQTFPGATGLMCREVGERWRRLMGAVISAGVEAGEFRAVDVEMQARVIGAGLIGLLIGIHHFAQFETNPPAPEQLLARFLDMVDNALSVDPAPVGLRPASPADSP